MGRHVAPFRYFILILRLEHMIYSTGHENTIHYITDVVLNNVEHMIYSTGHENTIHYIIDVVLNNVEHL
jgi:hypothetical protein